MLYKYHNQFVTLDDHHLLKAMEEEEKRHRNGTFKYRPLAVTQAQVALLKQTWPPDRIKQLSGKAREIKEDSAERRGYLALHSMLTTEITTPETPACKFAAIDMAFSMLTGMAPGLRFEPKTNFVERVVQGKRYRLRPSGRFAKMIVGEDAVKEADIYVFGFYAETARQCWLVGWVSQEDMISGHRGNWNMDKTLSWDEMSYYRPVDELKPMADLVRQMGIDTVPEGVIFEAIPNQASVPMLNDGIREIEALMDHPSGTLTVIPGLDDPQPQQPPQAQPQNPKQELAPNADDYTF
jgi:hypothetical protein